MCIYSAMAFWDKIKNSYILNFRNCYANIKKMDERNTANLFWTELQRQLIEEG